MGTSRATVAIIGGGASGTLVAAHLLRSASSPFHIVLMSRAARLGEGIAYSTGSDCHLLNVPARSMSAFEDDPEHFVRWLAAKGRPGAADSFVPRALYGRYLREALWPQGRDRTPSLAVETVYAGVVDLDLRPQGPQVVLDNGHTIAATAVVLATGVVMQQFPTSLAAGTSHPRCIVDPWTPGALAGTAPSATVTMLGSGLTAVDVLLALRESGHRGPVHAISRHGLLPRAHRAQNPRYEPLEALSRDLDGARARLLLHRVRQVLKSVEAGGADWRDVVDALRPVVPRLWAGLGPDEQLRFRRHLERLWSINRHRMAPQVAQAVEEERDSGTFFVHAGEVEAVADVEGSLRLQVKLPVRAHPYTWNTDWLVNCTGTDPHLFRRGEPLMDALMARGLARPGPLEMGVATDDRGRALDARGRPSDWLWAIGSLRQGQLLESTAVPEIRAQARDVALDVGRFLTGLTTNAPDAPAGPPPGLKAQSPTAQLLAS
jgi:uncharacterized NAD(P)/FAD-binding protein YdhS